MRRYFFLILFVLVLGTPFLLRRLVGGPEQQVSHRDAKRRLVIITPHSEGIRREFQEGFSKWLAKNHQPDVFIDYRSFGGGANDIVKFFDSSKELFASTGSRGVDIVWGGGGDLYERKLKTPHYLEKIDLPSTVMSDAFPQPDIAGVPLYDKDHFWYGTALSSFGIVYNKDVLRYLGLPEPKTWEDLTDPRYEGWIVLADPTRSSSALTAFMAIVEKGMADNEKKKGGVDRGWAHGMGLVRLICANSRVFADASASVPAMIGRGDAAAGMAIDFYGRTQVEFVGDARLGYVEPAGATIVNPDPIAIAKVDHSKGVEVNPAALLFVEFVLSEDGQKLMNYRVRAPNGPESTAIRRMPIRQSVYADMTYFTDPVNPFKNVGSFNTRKERTKTSEILGDLIQVSCIDTHKELQEALAAMRASPKSAEFLKSFRDFPFGQKKAIERMDNYKKATPLKKLEILRQWTEEFRETYNRMKESAEGS